MAEREQELREWASQIDWLHTHAVVCIGYSDIEPWTVLREWRSDMRVIVFEPDAAKAAQMPDAPDGCAVVSHLVDLRQAITSKCTGLHNLVTMGEPAYHDEWGELTCAAMDEAKRIMMSLEVTSRSNAVLWTEAAMRLLPLMAESPTLDRLPALAEKRPGIIVGAGPSLGDNLDALRAMQGKAVLCAVTSAIGPLSKADIQPDILTSVEVQPSPLDKTFGLQLWRRAILCHGAHVSPVVYDAPARAVVPALQAVGPVGAWLCGYAGIRPIETGGSVATLAYSILRHLGCDPIILIGVDCAFGDDDGNIMYAPKCIRPDGEKFNHKVNEVVPGWGGIGTVASTWALSSYRHWFEAKAKAGGCGHINANGRGALVKGWADVTLPDVAKRFSELESRDFGAEIEAAADVADVLDAGIVAKGLQEQLTEADTHVAMARTVEAAVATANNALVALAQYGERNARLMSALGQAPLDARVRFPDGDQMKALAFAMATEFQRSNDIRPLWEETIAALEEMNHARA